MVCEKCGARLEDGAVYCLKCGARTDGKKQCPVCGEWLSPDTIFCMKCGTRVDGKKQCSVCGKLSDEDALFCPDCGTSLKSHTQHSQQNRISATCSRTGGILAKTKTAIAIALAAISVLFVFFIIFGDEWLYYYFGGMYKEIDEIVGDGLSSRLSLYLPAVLGTITAAVTLITVFTLGLISIIGCGRQLAGMTDKSYEPFAMGAFLAYIAGVIALCSVHKAEGIELGASTITGIVIGSVAAAGYIAVGIVAKGKILLQKDMLAKTIFNGCGILILFVLFILLALPMTKIKGVEMSHTALLTGMGALEVMSKVDTVLFALMAFGVFAFIVSMLINSAIYFVRKSDDITQTQGYLGGAILNLIFSVILLVFAILCTVILKDYKINAQFVIPIILVVFSAINLVLTCVQNYYCNTRLAA